MGRLVKEGVLITWLTPGAKVLALAGTMHLALLACEQSSVRINKRNGTVACLSSLNEDQACPDNPEPKTSDYPKIINMTQPRRTSASNAIEPIVFTSTQAPVVSCSVNPPLPAGLVSEAHNGECRITGKPLELHPETSHTVTVVSASGASDTATFSLAINRDTTVPVLVGSGEHTYKSGVEAQPFVFNNLGLPAVSCSSAPALPAGLVLEVWQDTCRLVGTPSGSGSGNYVITATAANGSQGTTNVKLKISAAGSDTEAPAAQELAFTSLIAANEAADGYLNASEVTSSLPFAALNASGYTTASYTQILGDVPAVDCDATQSYSLSAIPLISSISSSGLSHGAHALCVKLTNSTGDVVYGKSSVVELDTVAPVFTSLVAAHEASDGYVNHAEVSSAAVFATLTASGYTEVAYTVVLSNDPAVACDSSSSYSLSSIPLINSIPAGQGAYAICVRLSDAAGNATYGKSQSVVKDTVAPVFNSLNAANEAADLIINAAESNSALVFAQLSATGYSEVEYTGFLSDNPPVVCDNDKTYEHGSIPAISSLPGSEGSYALCVRLQDEAGNVTYGKSQVVLKDANPPVFNALTGANEASDGVVNAAESSSTDLLLTLSASGYDTAAFTAIMSDDPEITCDATQTYNSGSIPSINMIPSTDGLYAVCVSLTDAAGNTTYGKSQQITRQAIAPSFTSLLGENEASDGYINASEVSSNDPIVTLVASDYVDAAYSDIIPNDPVVTCNATQSYENSSAPLISSMPNVDGPYAVCVRLTDAANNIVYGKSQQVTRDTEAPALTSFLSANAAAGGFINAAATTSTDPLLALVGSGYADTGYTDVLSDDPAVTCDATQTYDNDSIPAINTVPSTDGVYAVCVRLTDTAGNITYGKSQQVTRDATAPTLTSLLGANAASGGFINAATTASTDPLLALTASDYANADYTDVLSDDQAVTCDATQTYDNDSIPAINTVPSTDGVYAVCVRLTDTAGNTTYGKSQQITRDATAPTLTSLLGANAAADGFINATGVSSTDPLLALIASGYADADYTNVLGDDPAVTCDATQTYDNDSIPTINTVPSTDGVYAVCVRLTDAAGNTIYGKSQQVTRDATAPILTSLLGANAASGGFVNSAATSSTDPLLSLTASGHADADYTDVLGDDPAVTCDATQTYDNDSIPAINTVPSTDGVYAVCVRLTDIAGNTTYGKSQQVIRDTTAPTLTSLLGANAAADGFINSVSASSTDPLLALVGSGYSAADYTDVLDNDPAVTCDATQTYGNDSIPAINTVPSTDGVYAVCVRLTDTAGNTTYGKSQQVTRDATAPILTSLLGANAAANGFINAAATASTDPLFALTASGYTDADYTDVLGDDPAVTCDAMQTYDNDSIPAINTVPSTDGVYAVCVRLTDTAGNTTYGKSQVVTRDTVAPDFISLSGANEAGDGYVNTSELSSASALLALTADGYDAATYTNILLNNSVTCNSSQSYSNSSVPAINGIPNSDGAYVVCVRLASVAGNITYGKSQAITRDTAAPTATLEQKTGQDDPTTGLPIEFTLAFSEPINPASLTTDDISQSGTATVTSWDITNSGDDQTFTVSATNVTTSGTVIPNLASASVTDVAGNNNGSTNATDKTVTFNLTLVCDEGSLSTTCEITTDHNIPNGATISGSGNLLIRNGGKLHSNQGEAFSMAMGGSLTIETGGEIAANLTSVTVSDLTVESGAALHADHLGYAGGTYGTGSGTGGGGGGSSYGAGGGHGGAGGHRTGDAGGGIAYGSLEQPTTMGSGGGGSASYNWKGGHGGGAIKIIAANSLTINGRISANGQAGITPAAGNSSGGGAGGSIWLDASTATLAGTGSIEAKGGNGGHATNNADSGGGGGGRIALYASNKFAGSISVEGGSSDVNAKPGADGTYYQSGVPLCDSGSLSATCTINQPTIIHDGASITGSGNLVINENGSIHGIGGSTNISLAIDGDITIEENAIIDVDSITSLSADNLTVAGTLSANMPDVTVNTFNVQASGIVTADYKGHQGGYYGTGSGTGGGGGSSSSGAGGGHGGAGGHRNGDAGGGIAYGSLEQPTTMGSGGGGSASYNRKGGHGGGAIKIIAANSITINGRISANGQAGITLAAGNSSGGGAGGSIWLDASTATLAGTGSIEAKGGNGGHATNNADSGGGGGGRIALYASNKFAGSISVEGGSSNINAKPGATGTYYQSGVPLCDSGSLETTCVISADAYFGNEQLIAGAGSLVITATGSLSPRVPTAAASIDLEGDLTIEEGGLLEAHTFRSITADEVTIAGTLDANIYNLTAHTLNIEANGTLTATGKGHAGGLYAAGSGAGGGGGSTTRGSGGGHGGAGGKGSNNLNGGVAYGSATRPITYGSGGGGSPTGSIVGGDGGGAIRAIIAGTLTANGVISVNGLQGTNITTNASGGGAGGSIWINADRIEGNGVIEAEGGKGGTGTSTAHGGGGAGGRIRLDTPDNAFSGVVSVEGGASGGGTATAGDNGSNSTGNEAPVSLAWISSSTSTGDLQGLAGADQLCQSLADTAGIIGTWFALLSDDTSAANTRFVPPGAIYNLMDQQVATNAAALWNTSSSNLTAAIGYNELRAAVNAANTWTGTTITGESSANNCQGWSIGTSGVTGTNGVSNAVNTTWINDGSPLACNQQARLICVAP